ncbi:MAG TPA: TonB-dependent receptor [Terriglobales bacterium]|nr:TonB-dependent receptor [Terriglobales bacterium]
MFQQKAILCSLLICCSAFSASAQHTITLDGTVYDKTGAVVRGAQVMVQGLSGETTNTDERGHFVFSEVSASGELKVEAAGFLPMGKKWSSTASIHLDIILQPSSTKEEVIVSAARSELRLSETPVSTVLLSSEDLAASPSARTDDVLREVPGFSLFRRSSSRTANPSTQGVSLRGLGGSATSRALVLADGVSLIDPFGGWVYWDRVPRTAISTVEVVRGGASNLYGSDAMAGVIQLLMRQPEAPAFALETSYANEDTPELSLWAGSRAGKWDYSGSTEMFRTHGFRLVPFADRGPIDQKANVEDATVYGRIGRELPGNGRIFVRGNYFTEFRHNGTTIQTNDTTLGEGALGVDQPVGKSDSLSFRFYGNAETYHQSYSSIKSVNGGQRNLETLTDVQHVPEQIVGGGAQWTHLLGKSQTLIAGMDSNEVIGASVDDFFNNSTNDAQIGSGRQRALGWFGEDIFQRPKWTMIASARVDDWSNFQGQTFVVPVSGPPTLTQYDDRRTLALNPRLSVLRALNEHVSVTGSVYRAFRAPTLNELYRPFRVGAIQTLNNPLLTAERLTGAEAGVNLSGWNRKLNIRGTFFWSDIVDPIENVTIGMNLQEKENLGRTRSRGAEIEGVLRVTNYFQFTAGYVYTQAIVLNYPNPGGNNLNGFRVPQVPRNGFTWEACYWNPSRVFASVQGRFVGRQFDDDLNTLPLDRFYTMNFEVGHALSHNVEVFVAAENFTNQRYQVARTPVVNVGPPILARAGLRLSFPPEKK